MYWSTEQQRCVKQIVWESNLTCPNECKNSTLTMYHAEVVALDGDMEAYLRCSKCGGSGRVALTQREARDCGFNLNADLPDPDEAVGSRA